MIKAARFDIPEEKGIRKGTKFLFDIKAVQSDGITAMDLTGWAVKCEIRKRRDREAPLIAALTVTLPDPSTGEIFMALEEEETADLSAGVWPYDVMFTDPYGDDWVYMYGTIPVLGTVTAK